MMRGPILLSVLMALAAPVSGQQGATQSSPTPSPEDRIGFTNSNERMSVPVTIAGAGPYRFIVDTGAQRTVISRELAGTLGLAAGPNVRLTAMTGASDVGTVVIPMISVSTIGGTRIEAPSLESRNLGAAGMLGIDTLQNTMLSIDFDHQIMTVTPSAARKRRVEAAPGDILVHAKNLYGQLIVTDARYRGQRVQVILDTGSGITMGNLALQKRVARRNKDIHPIQLIGVTGESMEVNYTQIDRFDVAGATIANLPVAFADAEPFRHFGLTDRPALLLGMDALRLFRLVRIDFPNREIRLSVRRDVVHNAPMSPLDAVKLGI
jgi:predicted aspartyl protease